MSRVPDDLEAWLERPESWSVGFKGYGEESVGHASGRRNLALLGVVQMELVNWGHDPLVAARA